MISAVILTKNEESNITECIETVRWCDEVLVIDDNSTDATRTIAHHAGARIITHTLTDFATQRNFALREAKGEWVFFVDADERVSHALMKEIRKKLSDKNSSIKGYFAKRHDVLWGRQLAYGETAHVRLLRLARKDAGKWIGTVHEIWEVKGKTDNLGNPLFHFPHPNIRDFLDDINYYSDLRAKELYEQHIRVNFLSILVYPKAKFFHNYILRRGFFDGIPGIIVALMMSLHSFLVRGKLWMLWQQKSSS